MRALTYLALAVFLLSAAPLRAELKSAESETVRDSGNPFAKQQTKLEKLQQALAAAPHYRKHRLARNILREQNKLKILVRRYLEPLKRQEDQLKAQIRLADDSQKEQLRTKLAEVEGKIESLTQAADLDKWCQQPGSGKEDAAETKQEKAKKRKPTREEKIAKKNKPAREAKKAKKGKRKSRKHQ